LLSLLASESILFFFLEENKHPPSFFPFEIFLVFCGKSVIIRKGGRREG